MAKSTIKKNGILGKIDIPTVVDPTVVENSDNYAVTNPKDQLEPPAHTATPESEPENKNEGSNTQAQEDADKGTWATEHPVEKKGALATTEPIYLTAKRVNKSIFDLTDEEIEAIRIAKTERKTVRRGIILTEKNDKWVSLTAKKFGSSMNNIINELIKAEIEREEKRRTEID